MDDYDLGKDLFITQNTFKDVDDVSIQGAIDAVDSLLLYGEVKLLDFSNQKDSLSVVPDEEPKNEFSGDFPEVIIVFLKS